MISNGSSFGDSETAIGFMASKWVPKWYWIFILSLDWSCTQNEAQLHWYFSNYLEKRDFFTNESKHRHIIYHWKSFFVTINNAILLTQNKVSFGSDQISKFCQFVRKCVPSIWAFSLWMECTSMTRRSREMDWHLETMVGVTRDSVSLLLRRVPHTRHTCGWRPSWVALQWLGSCLPLFCSFWFIPTGVCLPTRIRRCDRWWAVSVEEREREFSRSQVAAYEWAI